ncbi:WD40 repeat domain-containing protein [Gloeothece verrucosa]|uniref:WD40 repeat, subgroup n=1 Tax=Gloeothece verrucosa (strain PCC 7822) TaxID=497965 RepID=E0U990_GLOV7|nr:WD40 repeat domain-containing protein [Gloeothece verrucosa]ADN17348.1 WD40 repeat, subgroup [Gloeothece verrucosa PCC 7822]
MGYHNFHWLDIAELAVAALTLVSVVVGIALNSLIYPIISLTIALLLNLINRLRFQYRYRKRLNGSIKQVQRQFSEEIESLSREISSQEPPPPPAPTADASAITIFQENLVALEQSFNNIIEYLNSNALGERIENLELIYAQLRQDILQNNSSREENSYEELTVTVAAVEPIPQTQTPIPSLSLPQISSPRVALSWNCIYTFSEHTDAVASLVISSDQKILVSGSWDQSLKVWEMESGNELATVQAHSQGILAVVFTGNQSSGYHFATGSFDQMIKFWSLKSQKELPLTVELTQILTAHTGSVHALACAPNTQILVSGSYDQTLKQWNTESGEMLASSLDSLGAIYAVALTSQGQIIASAGGDGKIMLWELTTGRQLGILKGNVSSVASLAISPDSRILAAGCADGTIKLWQLEASIWESGKQPQPIRILSAHRGQVHALLFSPDQQLLFSSGSDGLIKIWHRSSREGVTTLSLTDMSSSHANAVFSLALSSDGQWLAAGGVDGTIKVWQRED